MHTPDSNSSREGTEHPAEGKRKGRSAEALLSAMKPALGDGDREAAAVLSREAESEQAGNPRLARAISQCKRLVSRGQSFETTLEAMRRDLEEDRYSDAIGHFREVMNLSRGLKLLKAEADEAAQDEARKLLPNNWRVAEAMLQEAAATEPALRTDSELEKKLRRAREEEAVTHAIFQADRAALEGKTEQARTKLTELLARHEGDQRIRDRIHALDHPHKAMEVAETAETAAAPEAAPTPAKVQAAPRPPEAELDLEGTPNKTEEDRQKGWPTRVLIAHSAWTAIKNFSALAATTAMLGVAGILLWHHFEQPYSNGNRGKHAQAVSAAVPPQPPVRKPVGVEAVKAMVSPDEDAWRLVKGSEDEGMIREFLASYPASPHALRAKIKLSSLDWAKVDKGNVQAIRDYLKQHPKSPYRTQAEGLIADAQPKAALGDREAVLEAVRAYLSSDSRTAADSGTKISPGELGEPVIAGGQAKVQAKGAGGAPDQTFTLVRQDGAWKVQGNR